MSNIEIEPTEEVILDLAPNQIEEKSYNDLINLPDISGRNIYASNIKGGSLLVGSGDNVLKYDAKYGFWLGNANFASAPFSVSMAGVVVASDLTLVGGIIRYGKTSFADTTNAGYYISSSGFYFGSASDAKYLKYTIGTGALTLHGTSITSPTLTSIQSGSEIAIQGWQQDMAFTAASNVQVNWVSGTITLLDGTTYNITGANTGTMSAITYIYLDIGSSTTVLQTSTTASNAVGSGKILIAVAQNVATGKLATFQVFGGKALGGLGKLVVASDITANTITANEIAANTITANKMSVAQLSAITADLGSITAGTITGGVIKTAASGDRIELNSSGWGHKMIAYDVSEDEYIEIAAADRGIHWFENLASPAEVAWIIASDPPAADPYLQLGAWKADGINSTIVYISEGVCYPATATDLGKSTAKWQHLYLSGNIVVDGTVDGTDIASHVGNVNAHHAQSHTHASHTSIGASDHHSSTSNALTITPTKVSINSPAGTTAALNVNGDFHLYTGSFDIKNTGASIAWGGVPMLADGGVGNLRTLKPFSLLQLASDPASVPDGTMYYNTTSGQFKGKAGGSWYTL